MIVGLIVWGIVAAIVGLMVVAAIRAALRLVRGIVAAIRAALRLVRSTRPPTVPPVNPQAWSAVNALLGRMGAAADEEFARPLPAELTALAASRSRLSGPGLRQIG